MLFRSVSYWFWDLRPALQGTFKVDNSERFCAHFLLSLNSDNHVPLYTAMFVRNICSIVRERTNLTVDFDDVAFRIDSGLICGYIQFRTGCLRAVLDWVKEHTTVWLIDSYGPVYFETNSTVISHHTIKAWQAIIHAAVEYVLPHFRGLCPHSKTHSKATHIPCLKRAPTIYVASCNETADFASHRPFFVTSLL